MSVSHNSFKSGQYIERACFYLSVICLSILSETFNKDFIIIIFTHYGSSISIQPIQAYSIHNPSSLE